METSLEEKLARLHGTLAAMPSALVAYSGGVDSAFLLAAAVEALGARVLAVTARSASMPEEEAEAARRLAASLGARHQEVESGELDDPRYAANPSNRCFYCKSELFRITTGIADRIERESGARPTVLDGTNLDDLSDHRPGRDAARDAGVRSPLLEAGLTKADIRALSKVRGLPTWDKPAAPCLASRLPTGTAVTEPRLLRIAAAERAVRASGFRSFRVRDHEPVARVEIDRAEMERIHDPAVRDEVVRGIKAAGFRFVALDLEGLRSGSLNVLPGEASPASAAPDEEAV